MSEESILGRRASSKVLGVSERAGMVASADVGGTSAFLFMLLCCLVVSRAFAGEEDEEAAEMKKML